MCFESASKILWFYFFSYPSMEKVKVKVETAMSGYKRPGFGI